MSDKDKSQKITEDAELIKALTELGINVESDDIQKAEKAEGTEEEDKDKKDEGKEGDEGKDESVTKSIDVLQGEIDDIQKSLTAKQEELTKLQSTEAGKDKETVIEKSEVSTVDIVKGIISDFKSEIGALAEKQNSQNEVNDSIVKSLDALTEQITNISKNVEAIGTSSQGKRSVAGMSIIEKSVMKDENDKTILSISKNKEDVLNALEKAFEGEQDSIKKSMYEQAVLDYNAGSVISSKEVVNDLYKSYDIRLTN